uniref:Uncharacterized protein n=1 Tax=Lepeophtheirus salmonis TaxID=72036 RepID=A0A0K2T429_LEPSM
MKKIQPIKFMVVQLKYYTQNIPKLNSEGNQSLPYLTNTRIYSVFCFQLFILLSL